jgi:hypothetical protein
MARTGAVSKTIAVALISGLLTAAMPSQSHADGLAVEPMKVSFRVPKVQVTRTAKFDWLAKRGPAAKVTLVSDERTPTQIGRGSWICSPAGFGKKSRCYSN